MLLTSSVSGRNCRIYILLKYQPPAKEGRYVYSDMPVTAIAGAKCTQQGPYKEVEDPNLYLVKEMVNWYL